MRYKSEAPSGERLRAMDFGALKVDCSYAYSELPSLPSTRSYRQIRQEPFRFRSLLVQSLQEDLCAQPAEPGDVRAERSANPSHASGAYLSTRHRPGAPRRTPDHSGDPKKGAQLIEARLHNKQLARLPAPTDDVIEMDELCLRQTPAFWVWIAVSRRTRQVLGLAIGDHTDDLLAAVWSVVPPDYRDKPIYTDHWGAYAPFFPSEQQTSCDKGSGLTSIVEGLNTKWRQRQSGMVRRSCGVHINLLDDVFERFLLLLDSHNLQCERRWLKSLTAKPSTHQNP